MDRRGELITGRSNSDEVLLWCSQGVTASGVFAREADLVDSSDNGIVICGSRATLWTPTTGESFELRTSGANAKSVAIDSRARKVAVLDISNSLSVWDCATRSLEQRWSFPDSDAQLALSPNGDVLASLSRAPFRPDAVDFKLRMWDASSGTQLTSLVTTADKLHFSACGTLLAILGEKKVDVLEASTLDTTFTIECERAPITAIAFSRDNSRVFAGHEDGVVTLWDVALRRRILTLGELDGSIAALALRDDGTVVALSTLGMLRYWVAAKSE